MSRAEEKQTGQQGGNQAVQREMVERARALPGVADVLEVYGKLSVYSPWPMNLQPFQARNATGANVD